jgi:hypothetical protein
MHRDQLLLTRAPYTQGAVIFPKAVSLQYC